MRPNITTKDGPGVDWHQEDSIVHVRLNRPKKKNAITHAMYAAMADALEQAGRDSSVGAVLLTASGDAFTAGNDLADFARGVPEQGERPLARFLDRLASTEVPLVVAVNGIAVGIGVTMLLHCDLVFAAPMARFRMPFIDLGLVPEAGSSLLLPQLIGPRRTAELLYSSRWFDAREARDYGMVNEIVPSDHLEATARRWAELLASKSPAAVRATKALLRVDPATMRRRMVEEGEHFDAQLRSPEFAAAYAAFAMRSDRS